MTHLIAFAACIALTLAACIALEWQSSATARNRGPSNMPQSRKHIRHSLWTDRVVISYYDHSGRKVTTRAYPIARYYAVIKSARVKGYRVV